MKTKRQSLALLVATAMLCSTGSITSLAAETQVSDNASVQSTVTA